MFGLRTTRDGFEDGTGLSVSALASAGDSIPGFAFGYVFRPVVQLYRCTIFYKLYVSDLPFGIAPTQVTAPRATQTNAPIFNR